MTVDQFHGQEHDHQKNTHTMYNEITRNVNSRIIYYYLLWVVE